MNRPSLSFALLSLSVFASSGCVTPHQTGAKAALDRSAQVADALGAGKHPVPPPAPTAGSAADVYLRFALLNHPAVRAAFFDWRASVLDIAPAGALPDPKLTFEADIVDMVMTLMPGVMFDFMTPGKRLAMAREASATSEVAYRNYVATLVRTASEVRKAWVELAYVDELRRLRATHLQLLNDSLALGGADYATARGMASLEAQVKTENSVAEIRTALAVIEERQSAARARFKAALGLSHEAPDPAWPSFALAATALPPESELWSRIRAANTGLASMRSMVDMAIAGVAVAKKAGTPDVEIGAMADFKADPLMVRPTASVTLPIWRRKIAAQIAAAEARRDAAAARVEAEQITLAAELAQMLSMVRESERMAHTLESSSLPNLMRARESAAASFQSGMTSASMLTELQLMEITMRIERLNALRERELAVTDLLAMTATLPIGAPLADRDSTTAAH